MPGIMQGYVQLRGVGRWMYVDSAAYRPTPYPLRWACPDTHPTPCPQVLALARRKSRPVDLAAAAAAAPVAVPASRGSPAGSATATTDPKPEAEADWLASMGKQPPPAEKK